MRPNALPPFDFGLGEAVDLLRASVETFAADEIAPRADAIDRSNEFPRALAGNGRARPARHHRGGGVRRR